MNTIIMIPVEQLHHHPENPRKDLGDLTELTESIRKNGIMQNLTVVAGHAVGKEEWIRSAKTEGVTKEQALGTWEPDLYAQDGYTVVIGNRRMEAAKAAGLEAVPCVISDMDHKEQIATMLEENMQRQDLTVYEQAQGFQLMMDLGFSPKEISEKTGFSETTVSRRLKMAQLDQETFRKAVGKQITMDDLDRIGQIESVEKRNELLKEYGENNFDWKLNRTIKVQKAGKVREKARQMIQDAGVKKVPDKDKYAVYSGGYRELYQDICELDKWDGKSRFIPEADGPLYYTEDETDICFYVKEKKQKKETVKKTEEELEEERKIELAWKTVDRIRETAYELRKAYADGMKVTPTNAMEMLQWALIAAMVMAFDYDTPTNKIRNDPQIPIEGYNMAENIAGVYRWITGTTQSKWPGIILLMFEGDKNDRNGYVCGSRKDRPKHDESRRLDLCYQWLKAFGYRMSDEEVQMQDGTHPVFKAVDEP